MLSQQFQKSLNWLWDNSSCVAITCSEFGILLVWLRLFLFRWLPHFYLFWSLFCHLSPHTHTHSFVRLLWTSFTKHTPFDFWNLLASFALRVQVQRKWFLRIPLLTLILKSDTDSSICFAAFNHFAVHGIAFFPQHSNKFISLTFAVPSILEDVGRKCHFCFFLPSPSMTTDFLYLSARFLDEGMHGTVMWPTCCFHSSKGRARWTRARN